MGARHDRDLNQGSFELSALPLRTIALYWQGAGAYYQTITKAGGNGVIEVGIHLSSSSAPSSPS